MSRHRCAEGLHGMQHTLTLAGRRADMHSMHGMRPKACLTSTHAHGCDVHICHAHGCDVHAHLPCPRV
eukprot:358707-Chlamydomonas_euryale.AAC.3